ncbi:MAG TPA: transposase [Terriglobia bacterium]
MTVNLLRSRGRLAECDFARLAIALARMRQKRRFLLTALVLLPDHWHAIIYPPHPVCISPVLSGAKVSSMTAINRGRHEKGELWQERFFDHALRTVRNYGETVEYIHLNPVRRGLVKRPAEWKWSSFAEYSGLGAAEQEKRCGLTIDRVRLPANEKVRYLS